MHVHKVADKGFNAQADAYAAARPGYPPAAVAHCLRILLALKAPQMQLGAVSDSAVQGDDPSLLPHPGVTLTVLDLAAGTGKFTKQLAAVPWLDITAAEPSEGMRAAFKRELPGVPILACDAERIPAPDGAYDAVFVAQALHWFDSEAALREIARVLAPGGPLLLVWNMEDRQVPWVADLRDVYEYLDAGIPQYRLAHWRALFRTQLAAALFQPLAGLAPPTTTATPALAAPSSSGTTSAAPTSQTISTTINSSSNGSSSTAKLLRGETEPAVLAQSFPSPGYAVGSEASLLATRFFRTLPGHEDMVTPGLVWSRVLSKSYVASQPLALQQELQQAVMAVIQKHAHMFRPLVAGDQSGQASQVSNEQQQEAAAAAAPVPEHWVAPLPVRTEVSWCVKRS
mmetsp:Transcript_23914/g.60901  ORF Transcript_23914/g.60901 Transcript_23914/m.60901 type:complete len:399 (+) Transcript_23914:2600-3796(+)